MREEDRIMQGRIWITKLKVENQNNLKIFWFLHLQISNTEGELYCLSVRSRYFRWIQDFSSLDKNFTITPGNNGHLFVTFPAKALVLALDVFSGNVLWQRSIGPLSKVDSAPVVDSNGKSFAVRWVLTFKPYSRKYKSIY